MKIQLLLAAFFFLPACSLPAAMKGTEGGPAPVIRYVNIQALYELLKNSSDRGPAITEEKETIYARIETLQREILISSGDKDAIFEELTALRRKYDSLTAEEEAVKSDILKKINRALSSVAKNESIDFIFHMGDELLYAQGKFDITEDVLREIQKLEKRSAPAIR
ncbi:MAG: OmpH family outer membrane protein [Spirochaetia bacterium]|nr:OmpH family outer membrane protein [Spirochaetia bacterium]